MINQEQAIERVKDANIDEFEWYTPIIDNIKNPYARGYMDAKIEPLKDHLDTDDETFRETILEYLNYDIWEK